MKTGRWDGVWVGLWMALCLLGAGWGGGTGSMMVVAGFTCLGVELGRSF